MAFFEFPLWEYLVTKIRALAIKTSPGIVITQHKEARGVAIPFSRVMNALESGERWAIGAWRESTEVPCRRVLEERIYLCPLVSSRTRVGELTSCNKTGQVGLAFSYQFLFAIWRDLSQFA